MRLQSLRHYRPVRGRLALMASASAVGALLETAAMVAVVPLAQTVGAGGSDYSGDVGPIHIDASVGQLASLAVGLLVILMLIRLIDVAFASSVITSWDRDRRLELLGSFLDADWPTQAADRAGKLHEYSTWNVGQSTNTLSNVASVAQSSFSLSVLLVSAFIFDPLAASAIVLTGGVLILVLRPLTRRITPYSRNVAVANSRYAEELDENVAFAREIRLFGARSQVKTLMTGLADDLRLWRRRSGFVAQAGLPIYRGAGLLLVVGFLAVMSTQDANDLASVGTVALLLIRAISYGQELQASYQRVLQGLPHVEFLDELNAAYRAQRDDIGGEPATTLGSVRFESVSYSYEPGTKVIEDVSFEIGAGEAVGLVGPSGGGKSTVAQLLLRLRRPESGRILVDGRPVDEITLESWYRLVALVPQETRLLHATVADNIAFHRHLPRVAIEDAARAAGIHDDIVQLPMGYDTSVGPSTRSLSGGQVQRVGIARALAGRPQLLVLDEATSALDAMSEAVVQDTLTSLRGQMGLVVIAHRLSTLTVCDRILVFQEGRLTADGAAATVARDNTFFSHAIEVGRFEVD